MSWPDPRQMSDEDVSVHQREQMLKAFKAKVAILTGCPGSGKTHCLAVILKGLLKQGVRPADIRISAPTGKASVRASESLQKHRIDLPTMTNHRMLGVSADGKGGFGFTHNRNNQINAKYFILEEASMLGNTMAHHVLQAIPDQAFVLLIGDHHQLPPVESGAVLRDMLAAGIPHGDFREIFRNAGQIVACCKEIREGRMFAPSSDPEFGGDPSKNLAHVETKDNEQSLKEILTAFDHMQEIPSINLKWSAQILSFLNEGSPLARKEMNERLQQKLNPNSPEVCGRFRIGDKVICLKNNHYAWENQEFPDGAEFVANGQMGEIVRERGEFLQIELKTGEQTTSTIYLKKRSFLDDWDLGYAISIHKSQGSSWPIVIIGIDQSMRAKFMASRQLVYTALSRAETYCMTVGSRKAINDACRKDVVASRVTGLTGLLMEEIYNGNDPIWT